LKAAEAEVQRVTKEFENQKPSDNTTKLEAELARLRNELEAEKNKKPHQVTQPNQPTQANQMDTDNLRK
jgi:hypothetical protein